MSTTSDSVCFCRCLEINRTDLARYLPTLSSDSAAASTSEFEHFLPLRSEADCLQRWLDLNA